LSLVVSQNVSRRATAAALSPDAVRFRGDAFVRGPRRLTSGTARKGIVRSIDADDDWPSSCLKVARRIGCSGGLSVASDPKLGSPSGRGADCADSRSPIAAAGSIDRAFATAAVGIVAVRLD
jgi:hypothetical protein